MNFTHHLGVFRSIIFAATLALGVGSANAGLIVEEGENDALAPVTVVPPQPSRRPVTLLQRGEAPQGIGTVNASFQDEPLIAVLRKIVPVEWKAFAKDPRIKSAGRLTLKGSGRPWHAVLNEVMESKGMMAIVDWNKKEVTFSLQDNR